MRHGALAVRHVLVACPMFNELWRKIWEGENGRRDGMNTKDILNNTKKARQAARVMILTGLLG